MGDSAGLDDVIREGAKSTDMSSNPSISLDRTRPDPHLSRVVVSPPPANLSLASLYGRSGISYWHLQTA